MNAAADRARDARELALEAALRRMCEVFKPFTFRPIGAPNSQARADQDEQIAAHAEALVLLAQRRPDVPALPAIPFDWKLPRTEQRILCVLLTGGLISPERSAALCGPGDAQRPRKAMFRIRAALRAHVGDGAIIGNVPRQGHYIEFAVKLRIIAAMRGDLIQPAPLVRRSTSG